MNYQETIMPYIAQVDQLIKNMIYSLSPLYKENFPEGQDVTVPLFTALHSSSESVLILLSNQALFDADILLRTIMEGTIKYCYLMNGNESERHKRIEDYKIKLTEIDKISDHKKSVETINVLKQFSTNSTLPFESNILSDEELESLQNKYTSRIKNQLKQKWSYQNLLKELASSHTEYEAQLGSLSTYSLTSHFIHYDWTGIKTRLSQIVDSESETNKNIDIAHALRIVSNILSFYVFRVTEYLRCNNSRFEAILQYCLNGIELIHEMDKKSNEIIHNIS